MAALEILAAVLTLTVVGAVLAAEDGMETRTPPTAREEGLRIFVCGHSFHVFVGPLLKKLAKEAGFRRHQLIGIQMLGGSEVSQHWALEDGQQKVKPALTSGKVDVLTLSPAWAMPDPSIDRFVELGTSHNPDIRVVLQQSWPAYDGSEPPDRIKHNAERDGKTVADLKPRLDQQRKIFEAQTDRINARYGRRIVFVAPAGQAVLALREAIMKGEAPGIERQSQLFRDALGHGLTPVEHLVSYVFFACIYDRSPVGMKSFKKDGDETWSRLDNLLQRIAWDTVIAHPYSGVSADGGGHQGQS